MKKTGLVLLIVVALLSLGFFTKDVFAWGQFGICSGEGAPNDVDYFPYGYICSGDPGDPAAISLGDDVDNSENRIRSGDTVNFRAWYDPSGPAKTSRNTIAQYVLVWATIDIPDALIGSPPSGNRGATLTNCPGTGATAYAGHSAVYNWRDLQANGTNGNNASPSAYNPGRSTGIEDCQTEGRMLYWIVSATDTSRQSFDFNVSTKAGRGGPIKVRFNVSVPFRGDQSRFPPRNLLNPIDYPSVASHVVKQSNEAEFEVYVPNQQPPTGSVNITCSTVSGRLSNLNKPYKVFLDSNPANNPNAPVVGSGTTMSTGNYSENIDGRGIFGSGSTHTFYVRTYTTVSGGNYSGFIAQYSGTATLNCNPTPPVTDLDNVNCQDAVNGWAYDPDNPGTSIDVHLYVDGGFVGRYPTNVYREDINGGGNYGFSIPIPSNRLDGVNHDFVVEAIDTNGTSGNTWTRTVTMLGCGRFELKPTATGGLGNNENPTKFKGENKIEGSYPGWNDSAIPDNDKPAVGAEVTNRITRDRNGVIGNVFGPSNQTRLFHIEPIKYPPTPPITALEYNITDPQAGDRYCSQIDINPKSGLIRRSDSAVFPDGSGTGTDRGCDTVINKPYIKTYGNGIRAGGNFENVTTANPRCSGGGTLASWNNNTDPAADFGASSQLHAIALSKIVGLASAQTVFGRSPTNLSFANTPNPPVPINSSNYSPSLGGYFGDGAGGGSHCLSEVKARQGVTVTTGNRTVSGHVVPTGTNEEVFVADGDVYIDGTGITYNTGGWTIDTANGTTNVPSYKLIVNGGNIYIDPSVRQLDGLYMAIAKPDGSKGEIYTCGTRILTSYSPMSKNSLYDNCGNQLTVNGAFVAKKVNLMRAFGSMRNEAPIPSVAMVPDRQPVDGARQRLIWYCGFSSCNTNGISSVAGMTCRDIRDSQETNPWVNNSLCVEGSDSPRVQLRWTDNGDGGNDPTRARNQTGLQHCVSWRAVSSPPYNYPEGYGWTNNWLCSNFPIYFGDNPASNDFVEGTNALCTPIREPGEPGSSTYNHPAWQGAMRVCIRTPSPFIPGSPYVPPRPPNQPLVCSSRPGALRSSPRPTCAAEVFDFSPEFYISKNPNTDLEGDTIHYDAITSLPPVL